MKKSLQTLLLAAGVSLFSLPAAAWHVSEEQSLKEILFEEFTGPNCTSCPAGNDLLKSIADSYPERFHLVSYHVEGYTSEGVYNYRTVEGDEIYSALNDKIFSIPSGWVNRHQFEHRTYKCLQRDYWADDVALEAALPASVNLWMRAVYDESERMVTVDVEGYFLENLDLKSPRLMVAVTQNGIIGRQAGAKEPNNYEHNHMNRAFVTSVWGEELDIVPSKGKHFRWTAEYELPESVGPVEIVPENLEFVAFLAESEEEVLNSTSCALSSPEEWQDDPNDNYDEDEENEDPGTTGVYGISPEIPASLEIFTVNGNRVSSSNVDDLPKGLYILREGGKSVKIIR